MTVEIVRVGGSSTNEIELIPGTRMIDLTLDLDSSSFRMRSYEGFTKDMQFETEVIKDYPGGLGQIVRGAHMRLHAGTHVDAPSHMVPQAQQLHELPLSAFMGPAVIANVKHRSGGQGITAEDLSASVGAHMKYGDRVLLCTGINDEQFDGSVDWMGRAPYLSDEAINWCTERGVSTIGFDFYHGAKVPGASPSSSTSRKLHERGILTMPGLKNLQAVKKLRFTLIGFPLNMINVEASPIRAIALV